MSTTPRWLDAEERRAWLAYVEFSTLLSDYLNRQLRQEAGVPHTDYILLAHLSELPDQALTMSELAERLKITRSRLTHAVNRLQESGYVERRDDPANRRNQLAVLTEGGRQLLERAAPGHVEAVRRAVFDVLTRDQVRQFAEVGEAINSALQRMDAAEDDQEVLPWRRR
ncbi:MarR family winged helix-turn-helix transcriptional regulator [Streptomyces pseudovenezuelae]|uniref:DNA-binding MarR family transcriptional regulator n=1 Tax=Streptomyces pseudovenezuelae TaxID=67350 RepID=A0ABT6LAG3_9ACTN|nr:MarR family transcriptional regulator [Streptomyces pseudovenezuelae]MDH6213294.1 DNA-binding MarR family transcriptional regulator [Streptomyces pseudovenezuelae]